MARKFDDDLQRLKKNTSIEALCRERGIELKRHGSRDLIGLCPFHEDKNPSFVVTPEKNLFHCLGCDAGGSVIDLVMKLDGLAFRQAVDKLLPTLGGTASGGAPESRRVASPEQPPHRPALAPERAAVLLEKIVATYERTFAEAPAARQYLEKRGITDAGLFVRHRVGCANGRLKELLPKDGNVWTELKAVGVLLENGQERFKDCAVFPVFDVQGQITTLYGRYTGEGPKRHVFLPDRSTGLWNAIAMKTYSEIILVESVIDALSVMMAGNQNVIAIQGTNGLNDKELALFKTQGVRKVTLLMDGDDAGGRAAGKLRPRLEAAGLVVAVKALPAEHDPNSYLVKHGAANLARFLASDAWTPGEMHPATRPTDFIPEGQHNAADSTRAKGETLSACVPQCGTTADTPVPSGISSQSEDRAAPPAAGSVAENGNARPGGNELAVTYGLRRYEIRGLEKGPRKLRATIRAEHGGKLHVDTLDFYSARSRRILAQDLCRLFEEMPETIEGDLDKLLRHCEQLPDKPDDAAPIRAAVELITPKEKDEAETFGKSPTLIEDILADCEKRGLIGEASNALLLYVGMTSRKREDPISVLILSSSGAGKTALQDTICSFCPPEDLVKLTSLSGKALFYKERLSLKHKVLALEEGDGAEEASYAIRNLISARELVSESTIKDLATGRLTTMENKVEGPTPVFLTTTNPEIDAETKSRFWLTSVDESREQTRKILFFQRRLHESDGLIGTPEIEAVLRKHRNFQRLLKPLAVKNPFAGQLAYGDDRLQGRRDQPKYLNLIKAIAFLRQMRKEVFHEQRNGGAVPFIRVDRDDIRLANRLAHEILGHSLDELSRPGRDLLLQLENLVKEIAARLKKEDKDRDPDRSGISFSRRDIREFTGWTNTRLHIHLKELVDFEYIAIEAGRNGMPFRYRLAWEGQGKDGKRFVLGLKDADQLGEPSACRADPGAAADAREPAA